MQVFYVNIGGGEPTVRRDFWELVDYATAHHVGVKFSTNGVRITARRGHEACRQRLRRRADLARRRDRRGQRCVRGPGSYAMAIRAMENLAAAGFADAKLSVVVTRQNVDQLDEFEALAARYGAAAAHPAAAVGPRCRRVGRAAPDRRAAARLYDWLLAHGERVLTGDSFFHLRGSARRARCRAEPVRRRSGGVPDRPGRRRLRVPVRDPRRLPRRQRADRRRFHSMFGTRHCFASFASRNRRARARAAGFSTTAAADAWRRSSSPGCRSPAPTRSACWATARRAGR